MTTLAKPVPVSLSKIDQYVLWISRHWVYIVTLLLGLYALTPFLAPLFMSIGWAAPGRLIYWIYSFLCHQLPERSYFVFGPRISYSLSEIQAVGQDIKNMFLLRQFIGNPELGWKVAWSDRMVSMFISLWLFGIIWGTVRNKINPLPFWGLVLLLLPIAVDGVTHTVSDLAGIGYGFRDSNTWLATLTNHTFPVVFYTGDAWGSFNAWMRLITGVLFGLGIVWFSFPFLNIAFKNSIEVVEYKYQYRDWQKKEKERLMKLRLNADVEHKPQPLNIPVDKNAQ